MMISIGISLIWVFIMFIFIKSHPPQKIGFNF
jgi:hypothetical protein